MKTPVRKVEQSVRWWLSKQRLRRRDAVITQHRGKQIAAQHTFAIICGPFFDQRVPNAGVTYRMGLARAFEEIGIPYELVNFSNLQRLEDLPSPIVFLSESDFEFFDQRQARQLRAYKHFVWVNPWFHGEDRFYAEHDFDLMGTSKQVRKRVLDSEPEFVFTPVTSFGFHYYRGWIDRGQKLISLPLACDTTVYLPHERSTKFNHVEIAFVGGYWPYKARNFDLYLKPYEQQLTVFGYSPWPYAGYGGRISAEDEPSLYRAAKLSPAINEPHAAVLGGDICERVYKVLGSGGLCITDVTASHRDIFSADELLVPASLDEYHDMVHAVLSNPDQFKSYRGAGYAAIKNRHTYHHRALEILKHVNLSQGQAEAMATSTGVVPAN